ncbi:flagellar hook-basal body complex protein [Thermaerobacter sp. FW80]|uniref:flagellar hook-basal body complex protein n=1 Tax=Thermaerobacter sp. FW80 TaxID=2546351 RepID=UPI00107578FA|nr:flagellar hook-basal body complex protein [Thermaerobacter sp. FW80]QBS37817.1 flagellar hook-basal body complex protein [Thermaerobacter sp. FW80]
MMRSLYAAISGLQNHQLRMDVIGNNIANVNTVGFKASRVTFKELFSQTLRGAAAPTPPVRGGTNPIQIGLGTTLSGIDVVHQPGNPQVTGVNTDLAIQGDGFFVLRDATGAEVYTRAGDFRLDAQGYLVSGDGLLVLGWQADDGVLPDPDPTAAGPIRVLDPDADPATEPENVVVSFSIDTAGVITGTFADGSTRPIAQIALATFANPSGLLRDGHLYRQSNNSGVPDVGAPGTGGRGTVQAGALEMSNVDLSREFVDMIVTQRGFQANSRVITTSDEMLQELVNLKR